MKSKYSIIIYLTFDIIMDRTLKYQYFSSHNTFIWLFLFVPKPSAYILGDSG